MKKFKEWGLELLKGLVLTACMAVLFVGLGAFALSLETYAADFDVTAPCEMSTEELEAVLKYDLKEYAEEFLQAEEDYGINACFLASIAALESGWGRSDLAKNKNNLFGWKGKDGYKEFESPERCIDFVAWKLSKKYISKGLDTIDEIAPVYCNEEWAGYVKDIWGGLIK